MRPPLAWVLVLTLSAGLCFSYRAPIKHALGIPDLHLVETMMDRTDFNDRMKLVHARLAPNVPPRRVVLLGDSIAQSFYTEDLFPGAINLGVGGSTTLNLLDRLPVYTFLGEAKAIVIEIGINDLFTRSPETTAANIRRIVDRMPTHVPVFVNGLFPINPKRLKSDTDRVPSLADIATVNAALRRMCETSSCTFIDTMALADQDGELRADDDFGDGLHLAPAGYSQWEGLLKAAFTSASPPT